MQKKIYLSDVKLKIHRKGRISRPKWFQIMMDFGVITLKNLKPITDLHDTAISEKQTANIPRVAISCIDRWNIHNNNIISNHFRF